MAKKKPSGPGLVQVVAVPTPTFETAFPLRDIRPRTDKSRYYAEVERKALLDSIQRFGFTEPLILNPDHTIIHGQLRYEVASELGLPTVPVVILSKESHDYHMFANRIQDWGMWNHGVTDLMLLDRKQVPADDREVLRNIGWFANDVPESLTANSFTLEKVAEEIVQRERSKIYQFNPEQLLFVRKTRKALLEYFESKPEYEYVAKDIREYDFDLNPDGSKLKRRAEVVEAIQNVLLEVAQEVDPEATAETVASGESPVNLREFQIRMGQVMKAPSLFDDFEVEEQVD